MVSEGCLDEARVRWSEALLFLYSVDRDLYYIIVITVANNRCFHEPKIFFDEKCNVCTVCTIGYLVLLDICSNLLDHFVALKSS